MVAVFVRDGRRIEEFHRSLQQLRVDTNRLHIAGLRDGSLSLEHDQMRSYISRVVARHSIQRLVGYDSRGFDNHSDHIHAGRAAREVADTQGVEFVARIDANMQPPADALMYEAPPAVKRRALAEHISQDPAIWDNLEPYASQMAREQYVVYGSGVLAVV